MVIAKNAKFQNQKTNPIKRLRLFDKWILFHHNLYKEQGMYTAGADGCPPADTTDVQLNDFGIIVDEDLKKSPIIRKEVILDQYVVMPNHVHCIIIIKNIDRDTDHQIITGRQPSAPTVINRKHLFHETAKQGRASLSS